MEGQTERAIRDQRLAVILDVLAEAVTIRAPNNHLVYANQAALDRLGFDTVAELRAADPHELMGPYETTDEHGREIRMEDLPSVKLLRGEEPEPLLMRSVHRANGAESWVLLKAAAVRDDAGQIESAVTIIADVTEATRATQRVEFLARDRRSAGVLAGLRADASQRRRARRSATGRLVRGRPVRRRRRARTGGDRALEPAKLQMAERLRAYEPERMDPEQGLGQGAAHGRAAAVHGDPRRAAGGGGGRRRAPAAAARGRHARGADRAADDRRAARSAR